MSEPKRPNPDLFCLYIVARAWAFSRDCQALLDMARDDGEASPVVYPEEAAAHIRSCGVDCTHYADSAPAIPEFYWDAARCGGWVLVWIAAPGVSTDSTWAILDGCWDHPRRLLYWLEVGEEPLELPAHEAHWLGHVLVVGGGPLPQKHVLRRFPSPN